MKIVNTSIWPNHFIRRMLSWCIRTTDTPKARLRLAKFRKRTLASWSGLANSTGRIVVSIGPVKDHPWAGYTRACRPSDGLDYLIIADPLEALVAVTAHELGHIRHFAAGHFGRGSEDRADPAARYALRLFREQRESLAAAWADPPARVAATSSRSAVDVRRGRAPAQGRVLPTENLTTERNPIMGLDIAVYCTGQDFADSIDNLDKTDAAVVKRIIGNTIADTVWRAAQIHGRPGSYRGLHPARAEYAKIKGWPIDASGHVLGTASRGSHLCNHSDCNGWYLPEPIIRSIWTGDVSIGNSHKLLSELMEIHASGNAMDENAKYAIDVLTICAAASVACGVPIKFH